MKNGFLGHKKIVTCIVFIGLLLPSISFANQPSAQELAALQQLFEQMQAEQKSHCRLLATTLLESKPSVFDQLSKKSIISANEWHELQLKDLVSVCGQPETAFGYKGLEWLLIPTNDHPEIIRRQTMIKSLVEDEKLFFDLQKSLQDIEVSQASVLMYWDKQDQLMQKFAQFYYSILPAPANNQLNKSPFWLNVGAGISCYTHMGDLAQSLFLSGASTYLMNKTMEGSLRNASLWGLSKAMFHEPIRELDPRKNLFAEGDAEAKCHACEQVMKKGGMDVTGFNFLRANLLGSAGDRVHITRKLIGNGITGYEGLAAGIALAVGWAALRLYTTYYYGWRAISAVKTYCADIFMLRASLKEVATFIRALESFEKSIGSHPALASAKAKQYLHQTMNKKNWTAELKQLNDILDSPMFNKDSKLFLPGQLFAAHSLMQQVKGELVPAMQAVAEFDAYLSLAKLCKEHEDVNNGFTFVEFVQHDTPIIDIDNVWTPFVGAQKAVNNPVKIGTDNKPIRMIITGPNGGGKSIYFTAIGQAVLMAHSWGIVPGKRARMTFFNQIRTSFAPQEDKLHGVSKFMAQKRHISGIQRLIKTSGIDNKMLVLLDEPYDGTTEHLMAERVYDFGMTVKQLPHVVVGIATHVQKPIELANDGSFVNYHVGIEEPMRGAFTRTFKLEEGPAHWWFNDQARGGRYQDWLDVYMQRNALVKAQSA